MTGPGAAAEPPSRTRGVGIDRAAVVVVGDPSPVVP
jgi:hypothetical protein